MFLFFRQQQQQFFFSVKNQILIHKELEKLSTKLLQQSKTEICEICNLLCASSSLHKYDADFNKSFLPPPLLQNKKNIKSVTACKECRKALAKNQMPKYAVANGLEVLPVPEVLKCLNYLELQLISLVRPLLGMSNVKNQQNTKTQMRQKHGAIVFVPVPITNTINRLANDLLLLNDNNMFISVQTNFDRLATTTTNKSKFDLHDKQAATKTTIVNLEAILLALNYLKSTNAFYKNIEINKS